VVLATAHAVAAVLIAVLMNKLCAVIPSCRETAAVVELSVGEPHSSTTPSPEASPTPAMSKSLWSVFKVVPLRVSRVLMCYSVLYFTVLSPSGVTSGWLRSQGVEVSEIATAQSFAQVFGFCGAYFAPALINRFGLASVTSWVQLLQTVCLFLAVASLMTENSQGYLAFLGFLALSRFGLWAFDLCERETVQRGTEDKTRLLVFSFEQTATQCLSFLMSVAGMIFSRADQYKVLVVLSLTGTTLVSLVLSITPDSSAKSFSGSDRNTISSGPVSAATVIAPHGRQVGKERLSDAEVDQQSESS